MDVRRKSQDASRPPPRPRRPSASLPSVPLLHTFDPTFVATHRPPDADIRSPAFASASASPSAATSASAAAAAIATATATATGAGAGAARLALSIPRRTSAGNLRTTSSSSTPHRSAINSPISLPSPQTTIRAVTPDSGERAAQSHAPNHVAAAATAENDHDNTTNNGNTDINQNGSFSSYLGRKTGSILPGGPIPRGLGSMSPPGSPPRSIPTLTGAGGALPNATTPGGTRRQGIVFNDTFPSSLDTVSSSPPPRPSSVRPRGHTMDVPYRQPSVTPPIESSRHRVGSVSSTGSMSSMPPHEELLRGPPVPRHSPVVESSGYPVVYHTRPTDLHIQTGGAVRDKRGSTRAKLMKRPSRPSSPMMSPPPSIDSLPLPVPTDDANWILRLMRNLCGRMRGEIAYQNELNGPWYTGLGYIDDERGSLMFDSGENGPFHAAIISDLRGCRVQPVDRPGLDRPCLEILHPQTGNELLLWPLKAYEVDLWLAALLCWQQLRPSAVRLPNSTSSTPTSQSRPELIRRGSSTASTGPNVIKVSMVSLWDRGVAHSPRTLIKRSSARDLKSVQTGWRKVSCILYDNGEVKLITEDTATILCIIPLTQLSRSAIQQLDRTVLDEEFCVAIFPIYAATSTQLSLFRPVYISLDHRVLFEVWFVLMRAFTVPLIYELDDSDENDLVEVVDFDAEPTSEMFRVEKTINLRIIEAKLGGPTSPQTNSSRDRYAKADQDPFVGNYFAEVMLDGEIRARTITKTATRTPFWRDDCEFVDLPGSLPSLTVRLKRLDGSPESVVNHVHASFGFSKSGASVPEVICGCVDIPLHQMDRGREHEEWRQICDDRQQLIGTMLCKVRHEELIVFMAKDYQPLSEMLHRFSAGLTSQISDALPGQLRRLAEIFLNIFQVTNSSSEWLMALVEDEIDGIGHQAHLKKMRFSRRLKSTEEPDLANAHEREALRDMGKTLAGEANLLFRGNSLLTQALEFYMRRLGNDYIEEILADKIFEINEINPNCEVDPGKLQQGEDMEQHWEQLLQFTNEIWDCVAKSAARFPPELRHILKYIRAVAEDRYGDFLRTVAFTSVSGFLFLRFICPAILNPKLFGLLRDYPRPRAQRTLTLIAKALQALANLSNIGKKEVWMEPMNRFLSARRQSLKDFIDEICAIPAERSNHVLPASYSTPITILGRLAPLAREGFPTLPFLVDHSRNFASLVRLWADHNQTSAHEARYDGDILRFHKQCIALQERANFCMNRIDEVRAADNENASQPTDSDLALADAMEHVSFADSSINTMSRGSSTTPWMDHERPPGSSGGSSYDEERTSGLRSHKSSDRRARGRSSKNPHPLGSSMDPQESSWKDNQRKSLRNSKNAKKFLSGILRRLDRDKSGSPDPSSGTHLTTGPSSAGSEHIAKYSATTPTGTMRRDRDKSRGMGLGGLVEGWKEPS